MNTRFDSPRLKSAAANRFATLSIVDARTAVVFKFIRAILNVDAGPSADVFVVRAFVLILEPAPPADVIDQDAFEIGPRGLHVGDQLLQSASASDVSPLRPSSV